IGTNTPAFLPFPHPNPQVRVKAQGSQPTSGRQALP
ncbi:TPA_asm: UL22 uORF 2, partial [Human alphaherpesvirus 1]